jgi:putative membrane protein
MPGFGHFGMGFFGMGFGMILVWLIPIFLVALIIRYVIRDRDGKPERTALDILETRYARGEIDRDEYVKRRADLGG